MRGPGETEIETDRRIVRDKISLLKKKLVGIDRQMADPTWKPWGVGSSRFGGLYQCWKIYPYECVEQE